MLVSTAVKGSPIEPRMYPGCSAATLSPSASYSSQVVGDVVPELVEQGLVVPEDHGRQVVAGSVDIAVDRDGVERARGVAVEPALVDHALVERRGEGLLAVLLVGRPAGIVHLRGPHDVGPAFARLVEERDLGVERVAAAGVTVVGLEVDLDSGWSFLNASTMAVRSASTQMVIGLSATCSAAGKPYVPLSSRASGSSRTVAGRSRASGSSWTAGGRIVRAARYYKCDAGCGCGHSHQPAGRTSLMQRHVVAPVQIRVDFFDDSAPSRRHFEVTRIGGALPIGAAEARGFLHITMPSRFSIHQTSCVLHAPGLCPAS